jgi:hypothetical protein
VNFLGVTAYGPVGRQVVVETGLQAPNLTDTDCGILWPGATVNSLWLIVCDEFDGSTFPLEDSNAAPSWKSVTAHLPFGKTAAVKESSTL